MTAKKIKTKENVLELIRSNQDKIRSYGVRKLGLFGSFVRDKQKPESDIDLLVEFQQDKKSFDNFIQLAFFLEEILERRVELITIDALSPYIGPHIIKEVEYVNFSS
ncbi:MAG TPA: nucleotidyltransferase [Candidatus Desulfofervidus auxilii]|uniref:Nucleotidyltransferase n=1 Tax=Desulfofervidus auxilii TaxID=1621989 RepID=A0A7C1ZM88_DESA2|nr:nucleotidyltransferase [Candidatus Desulfofervidus auxilii]